MHRQTAFDEATGATSKSGTDPAELRKSTRKMIEKVMIRHSTAQTIIGTGEPILELRKVSWMQFPTFQAFLHKS
jgi:hypothetical protein